MSENVVSVAVTGGNGQIAYSFIFSLINGDAFGPLTKIDLRVLDVPGTEKALEGLKMEILDGAYPLLKSIKCTSSVKECFDGITVAVLIGAKPRGPGMERADLLKDNGKIFVEQGKALNEVADRNAKVFVVGNPANTNCLILKNFATNLNIKNFHSLMRLDQNRLKSMLAVKSGANIDDVTNVAVWGNHSAKQMPDFANAKIIGKSALEVIKDREWMETKLVPTVQNRGAEVIGARGRSSAASAARAVICDIKSVFGLGGDDWFSSGIYSENNPYNVPKDLIFGFPCISKGNGDYEIVQGLEIDPFVMKGIQLSVEELEQEKKVVEVILD